ncbi:glutamyl-tRNA reductase [Natronomonas salina]|uniref:glutamyl-tRNA reductase n=1 Tax=Natronomonas salina TaxID=1710540 RepID=UPI0015B49FC5|nr:glutamyl-tRNA reductase [Natronomonas salina]QLD90653.1 glutamyl-tRNA reductase [Natronomonas salina]
MTKGTGIIAGVSVSHSHASVEQIEAACTDSQRAAVERLHEQRGISEAFVLQTCNRAEAYVVADDEATARAVLDDHVGDVDGDAVRDLGHEASLRHLLRVACGLESLVLGEDQIIGQVRQAYEDARGAGAVGPTLDDAILKALHVGERARTETTINEGVVSLGSAAVRLAEAERDLANATALVVGAGEMATLAAQSLAEAVDRVVIANRTLPHAEHVVNEIDADATAVGLAALPAAAETADLVITATGSDDHVVGRDVLADAGETLVIDIAQPRDVAPGADDVDGVTVRDLDAIEAVTDRTREQRREAAEAVEAMIDEEFDHLISQYKRKRADQVIAAMYEGAERMKARELRTAVAKLEAETDGEVTDEQREILESMADALVGQLLSAPTQSLRDAAENDDWSTINTALQLFDPGLDDTMDIPSIPDGPDGIPEEMREQMPAAVLEQLSAEED